MATIHHTTLNPTKLELLTAWLPSRPWYQGGAGEPELAKAGGFRLDDPDGQVGVEFLVVTDADGPQPVAYLVPLTYRGAPLDGAEQALVGTTEHGVLGQRWVYDGCHDPVLVTQLLALLDGRVQAQAQSISDTPDHDVARSYNGPRLAANNFTAPVDEHDGTELSAPHAALRVHRQLRPASDATHQLPPDVAGHVTASWHLPDGTPARGPFVTVRRAD